MKDKTLSQPIEYIKYYQNTQLKDVINNREITKLEESKELSDAIIDGKGRFIIYCKTEEDNLIDNIKAPNTFIDTDNNTLRIQCCFKNKKGFFSIGVIYQLNNKNYKLGYEMYNNTFREFEMITVVCNLYKNKYPAYIHNLDYIKSIPSAIFKDKIFGDSNLNKNAMILLDNQASDLCFYLCNEKSFRESTNNITDKKYYKFIKSKSIDISDDINYKFIDNYEQMIIEGIVNIRDYVDQLKNIDHYVTNIAITIKTNYKEYLLLVSNRFNPEILIDLNKNLELKCIIDFSDLLEETYIE